MQSHTPSASSDTELAVVSSAFTRQTSQTCLSLPPSYFHLNWADVTWNGKNVNLPLYQKLLKLRGSTISSEVSDPNNTRPQSVKGVHYMVWGTHLTSVWTNQNLAEEFSDVLTFQSFSERLQKPFKLHFLHRSQDIACIQGFSLCFHGKVVCAGATKANKHLVQGFFGRFGKW